MNFSIISSETGTVSRILTSGYDSIKTILGFVDLIVGQIETFSLISIFVESSKLSILNDPFISGGFSKTWSVP